MVPIGPWISWGALATCRCRRHAEGGTVSPTVTEVACVVQAKPNPVISEKITLLLSVKQETN